MDKAIFELSEKLRHPSDIRIKLPAIEEAAKGEYEERTTQFKTRLAGGYSHIKDLEHEISAIGKELDDFGDEKSREMLLLKDFLNFINDYKEIRVICNAHQNFARVREFMESMKSVNDDCKDEDLEVYHDNIYKKEEFVCELEQFNYQLNTEDFARIEKMIVEIKEQGREFVTILLEITSDYIENVQMFPKLEAIVLREERRDDLTRKAQEGEKGADPVMQQIARIYPRYLLHKPKDLARKVTRCLKSAVSSKFTCINTEEAFISRLGFIFDDLAVLYDSPSLSFFSFDDFLAEYHKNLKEIIDKTLGRLEAAEILALIEMKTRYYNEIEAKYNKVGEMVGSPLVQNESALLEKYTAAASNKLKTWIENTAALEIDKFNSRDTNFGKDEDGKLVSTGFINLLQIIKGQLDPIAFNKRVLLHIAETVRVYSGTFRDSILAAVKKDFELACQNKAKGGFEDYCIIFGNSGLKLTQYISTLPQCQNPEIKELGSIFISILRGCNQFLAEFVISTCAPVLSKVYTAEWESEDTVDVLEITIEDFLSDYQQVMTTFSFRTFILEICKSFANAYIRRCGKKNIVIDGKTTALLQRDCDRIKRLLSQYVEEENVAEGLSLLTRFIPMVKSHNDELMKLELKALKKAGADLDFRLIKNLINHRSDLTEENKLRILNSVKKVFSEKEKPRRRFNLGFI